MRTIGLLLAVLLARALVLIGHPLPASAWTPIALLWEDLVVVLLFNLLDRRIRWPLLNWTIYGVLALYLAINLPIQRLMLVPLTWTMVRAAGGPLSDSISHYATWANCLRILAVTGVAAAIPIAHALLRGSRRVNAGPPQARSSPFRQFSRRRSSWLAEVGFISFAVLLVAFGRMAATRVPIDGLDRNPVAALVTSALPQVRAQSAQRDWSRPLAAAAPGEDLRPWRGSCAGRNVILILLESTGAQYLAPYGAREDPSPSLTRLAQDAICFENAYCVYPESIKGLFSVLCSQFPAFDTGPGDYARVPNPGLAEVLRNHGLQTALFHSGRFDYLGMESIIQNRGFSLLEDAGDIGGQRKSSFGIDEASTVQRMLSWIDSLAGKPFFLTYLPIAGHHPYATTDGGPFPEDQELGRYFNALHEGDDALGVLVCGLRQRGLWDKSLLVLAGDHGEAFGQHRGNVGHTLFVYEENVHVPLFLIAPGLVREAIRVKRIASLIDIAPTVLDLFGIAPASHFQGKSLLPPADQWALFYADYAWPWVGLRDGPWKFLHQLHTGRSSLFDLTTDPGEHTDLAGQWPERVAFYRHHLRDWSAAQKAAVLRDPSVRK